jgi:hypothetical protein
VCNAGWQLVVIVLVLVRMHAGSRLYSCPTYNEF